MSQPAMDVDILVFNIGVFVSAIFMLDYGADKFVDNTAIVASRLGISQTLVALLTAGAEWLAVVIAAVAQNKSSLALGNIVGSVISNILAAFSLGLLFQSAHFEFDTSSRYYAILLVALAISIVVSLYFGAQGVLFGTVLIIAFFVYLVSIFVAIYKGIMKPPEAEDTSDDESDAGNDPEHSPLMASENSSLLQSETSRRRTRSLKRHTIQLVFGFLALSLSGYLLSRSASTIASEIGISETQYGITILSFATTLPEKFVAVMGGARGQSGIVVANTVGSNIFLLTLCLGVVFTAGSSAGQVSDFELAVMMASVMALALIVFVGARKCMGILLLLAYTAFFVLEYTAFSKHSI